MNTFMLSCDPIAIENKSGSSSTEKINIQPWNPDAEFKIFPDCLASSRTCLKAGDLQSSFPSSYRFKGYDVMCGKHKDARNNIGNCRLRVIISNYLPRYLNESSRRERRFISTEIIEIFEEAGGKFLKKSKGGWDELSRDEIRNKVGHAIRDAASVARKKTKPRVSKTKRRASSKLDFDSIDLLDFNPDDLSEEEFEELVY